ncbi:hypothetical protein MMC29_002826 [Sticta canariensis]|nr:hypothetical protein [Sticta canariensis]
MPQGRALKWRTILFSTLGKTLYPYSQYTRALDLQGLEELLTGSKLGDLTSKVLFQNELEQFAVVAINKHPQLDALETTNRIGEVITKQTPLLEVLTGRILSGALSRWIPRLPQLKHLKSYLDTSIDGNGILIQLHCPLFKGLEIDHWNGSNPDQRLAAFLNELRPQSLESFKMVSDQKFGSTFQALSCRHGKSLVELELHKLTPSSMRELSLLKGCSNLVSLSLAEMEERYTGLETSHSDAFHETVTWLKECTKLRSLACTGFVSAPELVTLILSENTIHLTSLEYQGSVRLHDQGVHPEFYQALANQTNLNRLWLDGDLVWNALDAEGLLKSLSKLVNLTDLRLGEVSASFDDEHIVQLVSSLPKLEFCSMSGYGLTDAIWSEFGSLKSLRKLELDALTSCSGHGILRFIEKLGPGNKSLVLSVTNVDVHSDFLADVAVGVDIIKEKIAKKIEGKFELELNREFYENDLDELYELDELDELDVDPIGAFCSECG